MPGRCGKIETASRCSGINHDKDKGQNIPLTNPKVLGDGLECFAAFLVPDCLVYLIKKLLRDVKSILNTSSFALALCMTENL